MKSETSESPKWQPEAWFPADQASATAASSDETRSAAPGDRLKSSLQKAKMLLPLALEQARSPDQAALAALAEKIETVDNGQAVIPLAHSLTSRELDLVFPLLAALSTAKAPDRSATRQAEQLTGRIHLVIRERACPSLYESGWLKFQSSFPCPNIALALNLLCNIMEIKQQSRSVDRAADRPPLMISHAVAPNARHFIIRLNRARIDGGLPLTRFMEQYGIRSDLPLGNALIVEYFMTDDINVYEGNHKLFGGAIRQAVPELQAELLHHFFSLKKIPDPLRNRYCQQIYKVFDDPAADHPVWSQVKPKDRQAFQRWVRAATIGTHSRQHLDKARLYLEYSHAIQRVEHWDDETLLIYFRDFIIADSRLHPDQAICYNRSGLSSPFEPVAGGFRPNPADPAIPSRPIEDAIRHGDFSGVISLPFDRAGYKLTTVFLDMRLGRNGPRRWLRIGN